MNHPNYECWKCGRPLLPISGEFFHNPEYLLDENDPARQAGFVGPYHTKCIAESEWSTHLSQAIARKYATVQARQFWELEDWYLYWVRNGQEYFLSHKEGWVMDLPRPFALTRKPYPTASAIHLPYKKEFQFEFPEAVAAETFVKQLKKKHTIPVSELVEQLQVGDRVRWPETMAKAYFEHDPQLRKESRGKFVMAWLHHEIALPKAAAYIIMEKSPGMYGLSESLLDTV